MFLKLSNQRDIYICKQTDILLEAVGDTFLRFLGSLNLFQARQLTIILEAGSH